MGRFRSLEAGALIPRTAGRRRRGFALRTMVRFPGKRGFPKEFRFSLSVRPHTNTEMLGAGICALFRMANARVLR
jgi:hypothetical protein